MRKSGQEFELLGFDFLLDQNMKAWLIEVNTNPCLEESSPLLVKELPLMLDGLFRLTSDKVFGIKHESQSAWRHIFNLFD